MTRRPALNDPGTSHFMQKANPTLVLLAEVKGSAEAKKISALRPLSSSS